MQTYTIGTVLVITFCLASSATAQAQPARTAALSFPHERVYVAVGGGYQGGIKGFTDTITFTEYLEPAHIEADYRRKSGPAIDASGAVRVWRNLALGVGFSNFSKTGSGEVSAEIPHPFFFLQPRPGGPFSFGGVTHQERVVRVEPTAIIPVGTRMLIMLAGGPAFVSVTQRIVSSAQWRESGYPYDSPVTIDGVNSGDVTGSKVGFSAGGDLGFYFSKNVGVGLGVRFVRAKVKINDRIKLDAGGLQVAAGLRLRIGGQ